MREIIDNRVVQKEKEKAVSYYTAGAGYKLLSGSKMMIMPTISVSTSSGSIYYKGKGLFNIA